MCSNQQTVINLLALLKISGAPQNHKKVHTYCFRAFYVVIWTFMLRLTFILSNWNYVKNSCYWIKIGSSMYFGMLMYFILNLKLTHSWLFRFLNAHADGNSQWNQQQWQPKLINAINVTQCGDSRWKFLHTLITCECII